MFLSVPSKFSYFRVAPAAAGSHCSIAVNIQSRAAFLSHTPHYPQPREVLSAFSASCQGRQTVLLAVLRQPRKSPCGANCRNAALSELTRS